MRDLEDTREIKRILIALDASQQSLVALDSAIELAAKLHAELIGVFVEDINLVRLADFPFSLEIGRYSASMRPIDNTRIQRQMHAHARYIQGYLARRARHANLRWSMLVTRGSISDELIAAAQDSDLIVLGKTGWSCRREPGSTVQSILTHTNRHALILSRKIHPGSPILVIFEGSQASQNALRTATLIQVTENPLIIIILADSDADAQSKQSEADKILASAGVRASYQWIPEIDSSRLALLARLAGCDVVVIPALDKTLPNEDIIRMLTNSDCAVLLVH